MDVSEDITTITGDTDQLHLLSNSLTKLIAEPMADRESVSNFVAAVLDWLGRALSRREPERFIKNGIYQENAKKAQDYIEANYQEAVRIEDLCRTCGIGVRSLQRSFREYFDLTITEYVKALRFDAARRELVSSNPEEHTVSTIALSHGHSHLGRFSVEYRQRFGESPSETLERRAGVKA